MNDPENASRGMADVDEGGRDPTPNSSPPGCAKASPGEQRGGEADAAAAAVGVEPKSMETIDVEALRRDYELTREPVASILRRFGLTRWRLQKLRIENCWTSRPQIARPGPLQGQKGQKSLGAEAVDFRLNRLVAIGTDMLERKVADEGMTEANARTLKELCRAQETRMRSTRNEKAAKAREKKSNDDAADFRDDPNWLKAEFSRRLDLIFGPDSGGSGIREAAEKASAGGPGLAESVHHGAA
jgi:hypothetical protein